MSDPQLPALPEAEELVCIAYSERGITTTTWRAPGRDYFTALKMRDYARQAVREAEKRWQAQLNTETMSP